MIDLSPPCCLAPNRWTYVAGDLTSHPSRHNPTCSRVRGFLARRQRQRQQAAAAAIQAATRAFLERRRAASVAALKLQMAEMAGLMREYQRRTAAAIRIQVRWPRSGCLLGGWESAGGGCFSVWQLLWGQCL